MVAQSAEPGAHVLNARAVGFCGEGKTGVPREKPLGAEKRTNNKLNPHMTSSPGIEPGPHWWKASALTTAPSLLPEADYRCRLALTIQLCAVQNVDMIIFYWHSMAPYGVVIACRS